MVSAACGEGTLDRDFSRPFDQNTTAPGGYSISCNVGNVCLTHLQTQFIAVTPIFKTRVETDTREAAAADRVLCVSRVTVRLHKLGFWRFWECLSSRGPPAAYAPGRRYHIDC